MLLRLFAPVRAKGLAFASLLLLLPSLPTQAHDTAPPDSLPLTRLPLTLPTIDSSRLALEGTDLSAEAAAKLETSIAKAPASLDAIKDRHRLLGYYSSALSAEGAKPHILWLIEHQPTSDILGRPWAHVHRDLAPEVYAEITEAWEARLNARPNDSHILWNAAKFYTLGTPSRARQLLEQGRALEPKKPRWIEALAHLRSLKPTSDPAEELVLRQEALAMSEGIQRFYALDATAKAALKAGKNDAARAYAEELLALALQHPKDWNYGNAIYTGHSLLGQLALKKNDLEEAKKQLLAAGKTPGSPQLDSFGPDLALAQQLLGRGEYDTVLAFLTEIERFWTQKEKIASYREEIELAKTKARKSRPSTIAPAALTDR